MRVLFRADFCEDGDVQVVWVSIRRRLREVAGGVFIWARVQGVKGSPPQLLADVEKARLAANAEVAGLNQALGSLPAATVAEARHPVMVTGKGPVVQLSSWATEDDAHRWLEIFAARLAAAGREGSVTVMSKTWPSKALQGVMYGQPVIAAFLAW